jgi:hypothetical protein
MTSGSGNKQLVILQQVNQTPVMARCSSCELKFFVPKELKKDPDAAHSYLLSKFDHHVCKLADDHAKTPFGNRW